MKLKVNRKNVTVFEGAGGTTCRVVLPRLERDGRETGRQYDGVRPLGT